MASADRLTEILESLRQPRAFPHVDPEIEPEVKLIQTHISAVFLVGDHVYKIKKPVDLGFLDFSTLDKRHYYCQQEVLLNRRLAPDVYLGVLPVVRDGAALRIASDAQATGEIGEIVDYAVHMRRLPDTDNFLQRLRNDELTPELLTRVAQRLSEFHENAERSDKTRSFGEFEVVSQNALENFEQTHAHRGLTVSAPLHSRLEQRTRDQLQELRPLIEQRASQGRPCDTHGDLRLDHIYWTPGETHELPIIDCIEFNQRFRYADPLADGAFLAMDLELEATPELAQHFAHAFLDASGESDSAEQLFRFYVAYRAVVRAKVDGFKAQEPEVPVDQRQAATRAATAHWLLAARLLSEPQHAPALVLVGGLPGTGKSTLSRQLAEAAGFTVIRSDVVRKQLLDLQPTDSKRADFGEGIYSAEHTQRTYDECWNRAAELLRLGQRVIVDASFTRSAHRTRLADEAKSMGVRTLFLICQTPAATARRRITKRQGDPSDATPRVHTELQKQWDAVADTLPHATLDTRHDPNATLQESLKALREYGLW